MNNSKYWNSLKLAAVIGFTAVAIGAMGAHALKPHLSDYQLNIFEKGVQYHFFHALALLGVGILENVWGRSPQLRLAGFFFTAGVFCFSGSLYLLACRDLLAFPVGWAGPVTPVGGILFMAGWAMVFFSSNAGGLKSQIK